MSSTKLNLNATSFVPRRKAAGNTNNSGSVNKSVGDTRPKTQTTISQQQNTTPQRQTNSMNQQTNQNNQQQSPQQTFKALLYWEPKDSNGSVLDEAYCIECIPSDFWQRLGDLNDTIRSFERCFGTSFK